MLRRFLSYEDAISEEFTSLPALSIVMIGFTLFIVLLANTYGAYYDRMDRIEIYQSADLVATKLVGSSCCFIRAGGIVNFPLIESGACDERMNESRVEYQHSGLDFTLIVSYQDGSVTFPVLPVSDRDRVAVSRDVGVLVNDAEIFPGKLTVVMWKV